MMVDAVGKLHLLQICDKRLVFRIVLVSGIVLIDVFKQIAHRQIVFTILIPYNITSGYSGFREIVNQCFLLQ